MTETTLTTVCAANTTTDLTGHTCGGPCGSLEPLVAFERSTLSFAYYQAVHASRVRPIWTYMGVCVSLVICALKTLSDGAANEALLQINQLN